MARARSLGNPIQQLTWDKQFCVNWVVSGFYRLVALDGDGNDISGNMDDVRYTHISFRGALTVHVWLGRGVRLNFRPIHRARVGLGAAVFSGFLSAPPDGRPPLPLGRPALPPRDQTSHLQAPLPERFVVVDSEWIIMDNWTATNATLVAPQEGQIKAQGWPCFSFFSNMPPKFYQDVREHMPADAEGIADAPLARSGGGP